jgi:hypothetical protein
MVGREIINSNESEFRINIRLKKSQNKIVLEFSNFDNLDEFYKVLNQIILYNDLRVLYFNGFDDEHRKKLYILFDDKTKVQDGYITFTNSTENNIFGQYKLQIN